MISPTRKTPSADSEGFDVARWLAAKGVTCFVLKYRLVECHTDDPTTEIMTKGNLDQEKPAELHLYAKGGHGFGMRKQNIPTDHWIERFVDWLEVQGLMKK